MTPTMDVNDADVKSADANNAGQEALANGEAAAVARQPGSAQGGAARPLPADALAIVPLRNVVLFPGVIAPVTVGRESSKAAAQEAARNERRVGFLLQRDPSHDSPRPELARRQGKACEPLFARQHSDRLFRTFRDPVLAGANFRRPHPFRGQTPTRREESE